MKKRILSAAAALILLINVIAAPAAAGAYPEITGVSLADGILSWDSFGGADQYWLGIDGGYVPVSSGLDLKEMIVAAGRYEMSVEAADASGEIIAATGFKLSCDGKNYVIGEKSILGGWWGTSGNDYIKSFTADGCDIRGGEALMCEPGHEVSLLLEAAEWYEITSVYMRYDDENRDGVTVTERPDGKYECTLTAPDAVWMVGVNTRTTNPQFGVHTADLGRKSEGINVDSASVNIMIRTGKSPIPTQNMYLKAEFSSGGAFTCDGMTNGNLAETYTSYNFWLYADPSLPEGEYTDVITLYYDGNGNGSDWVAVDSCEVKLSVVKPGDPVSAENWWCTTGDYIASFELDGVPFDQPVKLTPESTATASVKTRDGYAVSSVFLRYLDQNTAEGVTVTKLENNEYDVSFTVPENDFSIGINVERDDMYVRIEFSPNGGEGSMDPIYVRSDETTVLPESSFTPPDGMELECWRFLSADTMVRYDQDYPYTSHTFEEDTVLEAVWKEKDTVSVVFDPGMGEGEMDPTHVKKGDYVLPESGFTPPSDSRFSEWYVEIYRNAEWSGVGYFKAGETVTAYGDIIRLNAVWAMGADTETDETVTDQPTEPAETSGNVTETDTDVGAQTGSGPADTGTDTEKTGNKHGSRTAVIVFAVIGAVLVAAAAVLAVYIIKKRVPKEPAGQSGDAEDQETGR